MRREQSIGELATPIIESMVNDSPLKRTFNEINDSMVNDRGRSDKVQKIDRITNDIVHRYTRFGYDAEAWRKAICKAVWRLPSEARVYEIYESSFNPWIKDSLRYFLGACRREYERSQD